MGCEEGQSRVRDVNGKIADDKFCWTRTARLTLAVGSWMDVIHGPG